MAGAARHVVFLPVVALAFLVAGAVFWYGPSTPVACSERPGWADHYGHIDGPGGPGFKGCLAPSTANYVLTALVLVGILSIGGLIWVAAGLIGSKPPRGRVFMDAKGNVVPPPTSSPGREHM